MSEPNERYICIHGHFYQPPRENPWLEAIEVQDSAYPFHDWNERITAECYAPNAAARILDEDGRIAGIVNNYSHISFNFGPTLLSWLQTHAKNVYDAILGADARSADRFGGHGSAMAQAVHHLIMPLANARDRRTQVRWGIRDFETRFGRRPEGMWLPETAVNLDTLEALAEGGIRFTVLAPHQAERIRPLQDGSEPSGDPAPTPKPWVDVGEDGVDTTRAYLQRLPSGRSIALFFYDGPISRGVAFENLLESGEQFAERVTHAFRHRAGPQLAHIATDGETYGHHHTSGDMALAYAVHHIEWEELGRLTNYGEFLELHPPAWEVQIREDTSWSCAHGIERWRSDCGCHTGGRPDWNQRWRGPLRDALDWLRDELAPRYEREASALLENPWVARDEYIDVVLDRSFESRAAFLREQQARELDESERVRAWELLEMQRHAMLMFTSCGWFFNELSGIETTQVLQYAGRAIQLAEKLFDAELEEPFLERLEGAESNLPEAGTGRDIYERHVATARVDLLKVAAHFAVSSLFTAFDRPTHIYQFEVEVHDHLTAEAGQARVGVGHATITSTVTGESSHVSFAAIRMAEHTVSGGAHPFESESAYRAVADEVANAFRSADFTALLRLMDNYFRAEVYSLRSLFQDEQRRILERAMAPSRDRAQALYRQIYDRNAPLMRFLRDLSLPQPREFRLAAELVLNTDLRRSIESDELDPDTVLSLVGEAAESDVDLDLKGLGFALTRTMERATARLLERPLEPDRLERLVAMARLLTTVPFDVNIWTVQNGYWQLMRSVLPERRQAAAGGDENAAGWVAQFEELGEMLHIVVPATSADDATEPSAVPALAVDPGPVGPRAPR